MRRIAWLLLAGMLAVSSWTAYQIYPSQKWWMRPAYVRLWHTANWITGHDFPVPDRFK